MKLTVLILTTFLLQVSAAGYAQKISLTKTDASLQGVIKEIRKQSGYDFVYTTPQMKQAKPVNIKVVNMPLIEALNLCFADQPFTYVMEDKIIIIKDKPVIVVPAQRVDVEGKVMDGAGKPVSGASIKIKGLVPSPVVITDQDGYFRINVPSADAVLLVSFIGYKTQEVAIKGKAGVLSIRLVVEESKLNEVVVSTGIFKKADKSFTGSSTTITAKELQQFGTRNLITSIRNIDPSFNIIESNSFGSDPNRLPEITIRGNSSIPNVNDVQDQTRVGLNTPLIILDGFQSTLQTLLDMNENEVESITILKDAAATAIYGSRGSNGVVVITTLSPKMGKLKLSFRSDVNVELADLTAYNLLNAREKLELERKVGMYSATRPDFDLTARANYDYLLNQVNSGVETDWLALPIRSGIGQRHNIRIEGGDQALRYSASAQLNDIEGTMKDSYRKTFNGTVTLSYTYRNLRFRNNLQIQQGKTQASPYGTFSEYAKMNPYWNAFDEEGNVIKLLGGLTTTSTSPVNPLYNANLNTFDRTTTSTIVNNSSVELTLFKDLIVRAQLGITKGNSQSDAFRPADHTAFANYSTEDIFRKGDYRYGIGNTIGYDGSMNITYSKTFGSKHVLFAGVDYNMRSNENSQYTFLAEGFPNARFDFISTALQYAKDSKPTGSEGNTRSVGLTSNVNYIYAGKYFIDASFRIDGASQFGSSKRFAPFWSTGIGWNLHNEEFLKDNKIVNRLKLRGSIGVTGSQNFNAYQAQSTYSYFTDARYFNWMGAYLLGLGNPALQWQQAMKYNVGTDIEFFKSRMKLGADYYIETTNDLISSVNLPLSSGYPYYTGNIGSLRNTGFELKATGFIVANPQKFTWSVSAAAMHNKNKVLKTSQALKDAQKTILNGTTDPGTLYLEGHSSSDIWVVPSLGIDPGNGKEVYLGADGLPTYIWDAASMAVAGSTDPKIFGNFSTMLRYKNLSVNASFSYRYGGQQYNKTLVDKVEVNSYIYNVDARVYQQRWQNPGDLAAFKSLFVTSPTYKTSRFVQNEITIKFQNISFQYDLKSKNFMKHFGLEALTLSANMADVFYMSTIRAERGTTYPFSKQFSFNINATF